MDQPASPRGYRILHRIPRLPTQIIENVIEEYGHLSSVMVATVEQLDEVDGIGEARAKMIKNGLSRIQEQLFVDRHI
ncbi:DNA integrity scanning protein DisA [Bacillus sp. JCM 19045]|nr:DNA integrity scanning protein DisA [Bacillus sp. JCM 19045]